jgi:hypothetical protein
MKQQFLARSLLLGLLTASVSALVETAPAQAFSWSQTYQTITLNPGDQAGTSFSVNFNQGYIDGQLTQGLTSRAVFTLLEAFTSTTAKFRVDLTNTSYGFTTASRMSGLGFDVDPGLTNATASGIFSQALLEGTSNTMIGGYGRVDICYTNGNTCAGGRGTGNSGGVLLGQTGSFNTNLTFANSSSDYVFRNFVVRYQSVNLEDGRTGQSGYGVGEVPTPALIPGLIGMGVAALRKKRQTTQEESKEASQIV